MRELSEQLEGVIGEWRSRLMSITDEAASLRNNETAWSAKEILGHLIDSAANNHQRDVRLQLASDLDLPGYQQESWVRSQRYGERRWRDLVEFWSAYNLHLARLISRFPEESLRNRAMIGGGDPMTLEFIATDYLRHLRHHLAQIAERYEPTTARSDSVTSDSRNE